MSFMRHCFARHSFIEFTFTLELSFTFVFSFEKIITMVLLINSFLLTSTFILFVSQWPLISGQGDRPFLSDYRRCGENNVYCMGSSNGCIAALTCDFLLFVENRDQGAGGPLFKYYIREQNFASDYAWNFLYFTKKRAPGVRHEGR